MYVIKTLNEMCAKCGKNVLRDIHQEHIIIKKDTRYCKCKDIY